MRAFLNRKSVKLVFFLSVLLIACLPRFIGLQHPSMTCDESSDYNDSLRFLRHIDLRSPVSDGYLNGQLPFVVSSLFYKFLGKDEWVARAVSAVFSLLAICAVFFISRALFGYWWAIFAVLMLGLCPFYLSASRLAFSHGHGFPGVFILAALYSLVKAFSGSSKSVYTTVVLAAFLSGLACGSDLVSIFWVLNIFLALIYGNRKNQAGVQVMAASLFFPVAYAGFFTASPMYTFGLSKAVAYVSHNQVFWNSLQGYLWLGRVVKMMPADYYLVVAAVKFTPLVLALGVGAFIFCIVRFKTFHPFCRYLAFCFWPLIYFSFKPWKTPYYLVPFIPIFYILVTYALVLLFRGRQFSARLSLRIILLVLVIGMQAYSAVSMYPDYLMSGIRYGEKFYGEFQGPAVSHGQWIGEAMQFIRQDGGDKGSEILIFKDVAEGQIDYYSEKYHLAGVKKNVSFTPEEKYPDSIPGIRYIILNQDALRLVAPLHSDAIRQNAGLASFLRASRDYKIVKTFYSGNFPMLWVYKRK